MPSFTHGSPTSTTKDAIENERVMTMFATLKQAHPEKFEKMMVIMHDCQNGNVDQTQFPKLSLRLLKGDRDLQFQFASYFGGGERRV